MRGNLFLRDVDKMFSEKISFTGATSIGNSLNYVISEGNTAFYGISIDHPDVSCANVTQSLSRGAKFHPAYGTVGWHGYELPFLFIQGINTPLIDQFELQINGQTYPSIEAPITFELTGVPNVVLDSIKYNYSGCFLDYNSKTGAGYTVNNQTLHTLTKDELDEIMTYSTFLVQRCSQTGVDDNKKTNLMLIFLDEGISFMQSTNFSLSYVGLDTWPTS